MCVCALVGGEEERFQRAFVSVRLIGSKFQMVGPAYENARAHYVAILRRRKSSRYQLRAKVPSARNIGNGLTQ